MASNSFRVTQYCFSDLLSDFLKEAMTLPSVILEKIRPQLHNFWQSIWHAVKRGNILKRNAQPEMQSVFDVNAQATPVNVVTQR